MNSSLKNKNTFPLSDSKIERGNEPRSNTLNLIKNLNKNSVLCGSGGGGGPDPVDKLCPNAGGGEGGGPRRLYMTAQIYSERSYRKCPTTLKVMNKFKFVA